MNERWLKLQDWWMKRDLREKRILQLGGIVFAIALIYGLLLSPLMSLAENSRTQIKTQEKTLAVMKSMDAQIKVLEKSNGNKNVAHTPVSVLSALQTEINAENLQQYASQLKQITNDVIEVHFQNVEFDKLMTLLITALKKQPLVIVQFSAIATNNPGQVNADVQLKVS